VYNATVVRYTPIRRRRLRSPHDFTGLSRSMLTKTQAPPRSKFL
jgi:hypothetical protein